MSLFGRFRFWAPTRFPGVICPRYDPDCTLLDLSQYSICPFKFHYDQRLSRQEVPKISMEIDYILVPVAPSARRRLPDTDTHTVLGNILFVVRAFEHSFCVSSILHMWYLKG